MVLLLIYMMVSIKCGQNKVEEHDIDSSNELSKEETRYDMKDNRDKIKEEKIEEIKEDLEFEDEEEEEKKADNPIVKTQDTARNRPQEA
mmetsp:Transcript_32701/g.28970  ORF Transcript_32701/g.28970 Transcript_32701/m.28970 type:complete len:89 (+) Transcript_32701:1103-1369(+)